MTPLAWFTSPFIIYSPSVGTDVDISLSSSRRSVLPEMKKWDVFRVIPPDNDSGSAANQRCLDITIKVVKVVVYIITFCIVLTSGVIAKGTTLFMTSQLKQHKSLEYCNKRIGKPSIIQTLRPGESDMGI